MFSLGDYFPDSEKLNHINRSLIPGCVVYLHCGFTRPPKDKYLVVVCLEGDPIVFVINSKINDYISSRPHLLACQVNLLKKEDDFLDRDSIINCGEAINLSEEEIRRQIMADTSRLIGHLSSSAIDKVKAAVTKSVTLSDYQKNQIFQALESS